MSSVFVLLKLSKKWDVLPSPLTKQRLEAKRNFNDLLMLSKKDLWQSQEFRPALLSSSAELTVLVRSVAKGTFHFLPRT